MKPILLDLPTELTTDRLHLRVPRPGDGVAHAGPLVSLSLAELKPWMPWATEPYDETAAEIFCREAAAKFILRQELQFLIFTHADEFIGTIGLHHLDWSVPMCEIGYWLGTPFVGQGYMTEALTRVTNFAFETLKMIRVEVRTDTRNERSRRVAERCGFVLEGTLRHHKLDPFGVAHDGCIYAHTA